MAPPKAHADGVQLGTCKIAVAFSAFSGFPFVGGPVASEKKEVSGNAFSPGEIWFSFPQRVPLLFVFSFLLVLCDREDKKITKKQKKNKKKKQKRKRRTRRRKRRRRNTNNNQ